MKIIIKINEDFTLDAVVDYTKWIKIDEEFIDSIKFEK